MMHYSIEPRDRIFVKVYGLLSFAKNMGKELGKNISKYVSEKYSLKLLDLAKQTATDTLKTASEKVIQKIAEAADELIRTNIADKITKFSKSSPQNNSESETEIPKERYISLKKDSKLLMN